MELESFRKRAKVTREEISALTGFSTAMIYRVEKGKPIVFVPEDFEAKYRNAVLRIQGARMADTAAEAGVTA